MFFCVCVLLNGNIKFQLYNNVALQFTLIFTTLLLHLGCIGAGRSGMYMMKYALCHPEAFTHPHVAFGMGFIQLFAIVVSETINIVKSTQRKTAQELITSYIGFKSIMDVPIIYYGSINNIAVKAEVGKVTATKGRKDFRADD